MTISIFGIDIAKNGTVKLSTDRADSPLEQQKSIYHGFRFPREIISYAVWLYYRLCLSFRDVEDLSAERGIEVSC